MWSKVLFWVPRKKRLDSQSEYIPIMRKISFKNYLHIFYHATKRYKGNNLNLGYPLLLTFYSRIYFYSLKTFFVTIKSKLDFTSNLTNIPSFSFSVEDYFNNQMCLEVNYQSKITKIILLYENNNALNTREGKKYWKERIAQKQVIEFDEI